MITFKEHNHHYESIDNSDNITWISVTRLLDYFKEKFNAEEQAIKSSKNKKSKWFNMTPLEIQACWEAESQRSIETGNFYHKQREDDIIALDTITREGLVLPVVKPIIKDGIKYAPDQRLDNGIYPEHMIYLKSCGLCGQSDRVEVISNRVDILDYKSNKEIVKESWKDWKGNSKKMLHILKHIDDCNFNHYSLQLSIYLYIILRHNPMLKPGKLQLQHVSFEKEGEDKYGYPILRKDKDNNYIVKDVVIYDVPYLKTEVKNMIDYYINTIKK